MILGKGTNGKPVHQLIMRTFIGEPTEGQEVRHKNGLPNDNRLENLEYGTRTDNIIDVYKQGKRWRKLRITEVRAIKDLLRLGKSVFELAEMYKISPQQIYKIRDGRCYKWDN